MTIEYPDWHLCHKKFQARYKTIIRAYRELVGRHSIHADKEYWSICGDCTDGRGNIAPVFEGEHGLVGSEAAQMVHAGLITPSQFHGVELDADIHRRNAEANRDGFHFHHGDINRVMDIASANLRFNPEIINLDFPSGAKKASEVVGNAFFTLTDGEFYDPHLVVVNIMKRVPHHAEQTIEEVIDFFASNSHFRYAWSNGWRETNPWKLDGRGCREGFTQPYIYKGTGGKARTKMSTVIFYRRHT